jgi:hypothetical protein
MRLPILMVAETLEAETPEINWFTNEVPESNQTLPNLPIGRVVEVRGDYGSYASANPNYLITQVQVDVWVKDLKEVDKYYYKLDEIMRADNVQCDYMEQTYDPDLEGARRIIKRYTISQRVG